MALAAPKLSQERQFGSGASGQNYPQETDPKGHLGTLAQRHATRALPMTNVRLNKGVCL